MNYYNEFDPFAAEWLRNLIDAGHIPAGVVDTRSIEDVTPADLDGFTQCHFFAGIGGWPLALRLAGWPDNRPIWSGSCPCQPFSAAGKGAGLADERHLWPVWHWLITQRRPVYVAGEQVASADGLNWLDVVSTDLENAAYAVGAVDLCAASVGAPHIRQRLGFVAHRVDDADYAGLERLGRRLEAEGGRVGAVRPVAEAREFGGLADLHQDGREPRREVRPICQELNSQHGGTASGLADADGRYAAEPSRGGDRPGAPEGSRPASRSERHGSLPDSPAAGALHGFWSNADWLFCRDGRWRPVEPGAFPLAHGIPGRVGQLRAYGNAIVPQVFAEIIRAFDDYLRQRQVW